MLFKKTFGELVQSSLSYLRSRTDITNTNVGGITRSLVEVINKNISDYYEVLDINMAMGFLSTSEGYYLDLIGSLFNMDRLEAESASVSQSSETQKFYVSSGYLVDRIPSGIIRSGTVVSSLDGIIRYTVSADTNFSSAATEVYVPITASDSGTKYNVGANVLVSHNLGAAGVFTTNEKAIVSGTDTESDANYKYRLMNATLSAEKANEISVRLAALSVSGVSDVIIRKYARGIGTYEVIVIPVEGLASDALISNVQSAIDDVTACGTAGYARKPIIVPIDLSVSLVFTNDTTDYEKSVLRSMVKVAVEKYIVNIPIGGEFIINELRQQIMDVSPKIKDHMINCLYCRNQPTFITNLDIYWDEMFYPNPDSSEAIVIQ